jgi:acetylornithine deacetylase/succinyl-diaminopimelate desuccinylase-like protein
MRRALPVAAMMAAVVGATVAAVAEQSPGEIAALAATPTVRAALDVARRREPETIEDQLRFCRVPAPPFREAARAAVLRGALSDAGLQDVRVDREGNVLGDRPGINPGGPRLVVAAHLDTVFPEATVTTPVRQGNVLRGPGIADNCRGLAALVAVVRAMNEAGVRTSQTVTFVANVGEEGLGDLRGVKALFGDTLKGQIGGFVTIDNAGFSVSTIAVGSRRYRITFTGPGGHSFGQFGNPNPVNALARAASSLAEFTVPAMPRTTFNVGRIGGGTSVNAIPADAWMEVDLRSSDRAALADLDARFLRAIDAAVAAENTRAGQPGGIRASKELVGDRPAGWVPSSAPIVQTALAVARVLGVPVGLSESSSDANLPISLGIPAIAIGAGGQSYDAHAPTEWFDATNAWQGTQNAVLLTIALAR